MDQRMLQKLLVDAQRQKKELDKKMSELESREFSSTTGGRLMEISMNGKYEVLNCSIDESILQDRETVQDLVISTVNDLIGQVRGEFKRIESSYLPKNIF